MKGNDKEIHDDVKGGEDVWWMVIFQEVDMRVRLRDLGIIDLLLMYLWYEKDDTDWALTIGRRSTSRIQEE